MLDVRFFDEVASGVDEEIFFAKVGKLQDVLGEKEGALSIVICDDAEIRRLNKKYRDKDKATDVLSFPYEEEGEIGDIFVSIDTARKQAKEKGHSLERELEVLFVHGMLHLFGYDHNTDGEEAEMEGLARAILQHSVDN